MIKKRHRASLSSLIVDGLHLSYCSILHIGDAVFKSQKSSVACPNVRSSMSIKLYSMMGDTVQLTKQSSKLATL
jgi:hypothetical protein